MTLKELKAEVARLVGKDVEWEIGKTYKAYCIETGALVAEYNPVRGTLEIWK